MAAQAFRNIRYASAPRFAMPEPVPFEGPQESAPRGPISPQAPSRLAMVMGLGAPMAQSEVCQVLSVFTQSKSGKRPVMVFLHGGAFVTGGGEMPWYDGDRLAAEQDVVVVSVTYRLGALGYLHFPGGGGPSPGMADQAMALEWIQYNIAAFGGDPGNVTLFGQSAGGFSIAALLAWGHGGALFHRAILQSGAAGLSRNHAEAEAVSQMFLDILAQDPYSAEPDELVAAQRQLAITRKQIADWMPVMPAAQSNTAIDMIGGWTTDDALPFVLIGAGVTPSPGTEEKFFEPTQKMNALFETGCRSLARKMTAAGKQAFLYRFDGRAPQSGLGACHCIELPFLLGDERAWADAPMLKGLAWDAIDAAGKKLRAAWANFARGEAPGPDWQACDTANQTVTILH